jgi:hypothetical protein
VALVPSKVIQAYLVTQGVIQPNDVPELTDWRSGVSAMPVNGTNFVSIYDTAPVLDGRLQRSGKQVTHPGIQLRIRGSNYGVGWQKGKEIEEALEQARQVIVNTDEGVARIHAFTMTSPLFPIGQEEKDRRSLFTINGIVTLTEEI